MTHTASIPRELIEHTFTVAGASDSTGTTPWVENRGSAHSASLDGSGAAATVVLEGTNDQAKSAGSIVPIATLVAATGNSFIDGGPIPPFQWRHIRARCTALTAANCKFRLTGY